MSWVGGVENRGWGCLDITGKLAHTRSVLHTGSSHSEANKEEHTAQGQHAPRGWGITPLHHVGGAGGGRSIGVRGGFVSAELGT